MFDRLEAPLFKSLNMYEDNPAGNEAEKTKKEAFINEQAKHYLGLLGTELKEKGVNAHARMVATSTTTSCDICTSECEIRLMERD